MYKAGTHKNGGSILVVRLGAMGDILHTLPAVASLRHSHPNSHLTWAVEPQWRALLDGNPAIDRIVEIKRRTVGGLGESWRDLRASRYDFAVDFQGLLKSALVASAARPDRIFGFHQSQVRERAAALFYSNKVEAREHHIVDRNLELAAAAGASTLLRTFPIPEGRAEAPLPSGGFVLTSPMAGWKSKQWPLSAYRELAQRVRQEFGLPLVVDAPASATEILAEIPEAIPHRSTLAGLIHATREASAVVGVDSGPLHLAAALGKPGVAIFGPTDPARNGPYGSSLTVLRSPHAATTYKRGAEVDASMTAITVNQVMDALRPALMHRHSAGSLA